MPFVAASTIQRPILDLRSSAGNAFALLAAASDLSRRVGLDDEVVRAEMTRGDYVNLVKVFASYFGDFFDIVVPDCYQAQLMGAST